MSRGGSIEEKLEARRSKKVTLIAAGEEIEKSEIKVMTHEVREITEYIEVFYNRQRRQARFGYLSPAVYERQFYARQVIRRVAA